MLGLPILVVHADSFNIDIVVGMSEQNCQCSRKFKSIFPLQKVWTVLSSAISFIALRYSLCFSRTPMVSLAPLFPLHLPQWSQTQSRLSAVFFPCMTLCHVTQAPVAAAGHFRGRGCPLINNGFYDDFQRNIVFSMPVNRMDIVDTFARLHPRRLQLLNFE